jgi:hypothetical protein
LGTASFYQHYFWDFASKATPMCKLLKKDKEFKWTDACAKSCEWMKPSMTCLPILTIFNWNFKFHVHTNISNFAIGIMLGQNLDNTIDKSIYHANRLMNNAEKNYITTKKEALTMIFAIKKLGIIYLATTLCFMFIIKHYCIWSTNQW